MSEKKFANLHYPGMRADPNEGQFSMDPQAEKYFQEQVQCLGKASLVALSKFSAAA